MKKIMAVSILVLFGAAYAEAHVPTCHEMDEVASSVAKINGATYAGPAYRIAPMAIQTDAGAEFNYEYKAYYSPGDELPSVIVGKIQVRALIKTGESKCKIQNLSFSEKLQ